jgi:hypothetical protein
LAALKSTKEDLLHVLFWGLDLVTHPTLHKVLYSQDPLFVRDGLRRHLRSLEKRELIQVAPSVSVERIVRLTEAGRLKALISRPSINGMNGTWRCWRNVPGNQGRASVWRTI